MPSFRLRILSWIVITAAGAAIFHFTSRWWGERSAAGYRVVPLVHGSKAIGLPLAGLAVDPNQKDVYAVVGGKDAQLPADFFVLWKRRDGEHYGLTLFKQNQGARAFCQMDRRGKLEIMADLQGANSSAPFEVARSANEEAALRSLVQALPPSFGLAVKP